ncbi:MAG: adenylate/guanylate cyclase domain-containing protein [Rhodospirillales bacterium]|jgi:adenylate cyclase|nr:adenylate/guanylate cyclase domain-containing protein [Rhodospirillales bacterium]
MSELQAGVDAVNLLRNIGVGIAIADAGDWTVSFENAKFFQWFPSEEDVDAPIPQRIPGFDAAAAVSRMESGRNYKLEGETKGEGRRTPFRLSVSKIAETDPPTVLVECYDVSKERQAEYMLESYSGIAERRTKELEREKARVERLLLNIMPKTVYEELKDYGTTTPQRFDAASILMLDFVGFTNMAISHDPGALVSELNDIFSAFDRIVEMFNCERLRTVGDSYMAISGLPDPSPDHTQNIAKVALRMRRYLERRNTAHSHQWTCRIGINTGPVIGSLVGVQKYVYDLFGPGVNLAARMESMSEPMKITLCKETYETIKDDFVFTERGDFEIKGFGTKQLYFLEGEGTRRLG